MSYSAKVKEDFKASDWGEGVVHTVNTHRVNAVYGDVIKKVVLSRV